MQPSSVETTEPSCIKHYAPQAWKEITKDRGRKALLGLALSAPLCVYGYYYQIADSEGYQKLNSFTLGETLFMLGWAISQMATLFTLGFALFFYLKTPCIQLGKYLGQQITAGANKICKATAEYAVTHKPQVTGFISTGLVLSMALYLLTTTGVISKEEMSKGHVIAISALGILACSVAAGAGFKTATRCCFHQPVTFPLDNAVVVGSPLALVPAAAIPRTIPSSYGATGSTPRANRVARMANPQH